MGLTWVPNELFPTRLLQTILCHLSPSKCSNAVVFIVCVLYYLQTRFFSVDTMHVWVTSHLLSCNFSILQLLFHYGHCNVLWAIFVCEFWQCQPFSATMPTVAFFLLDLVIEFWGFPLPTTSNPLLQQKLELVTLPGCCTSCPSDFNWCMSAWASGS